MSLTGLKPSRSMNIRTSRGAFLPAAAGARGARASACSSRSANSTRLGSPVSGSRQRQADEPPLGALALDRVAHRLGQRLGVDVVLVEVVLRAGLHGLQRDLLVVEAGEHDDRDLGRGGAQPAHAVDAGGVRQRQVEQDEVGEAARDRLDRVAEPRDARDHRGLGGLAQHLLHQPPVAGVVLDQQHADGVLALRQLVEDLRTRS